MIKVFYDGKCGLCSKEISYYKATAPENIFEWIDIAHNPEAITNETFSQSEGLKRLHAKDKNGKMHIGVDAFILIWRNIRYWKILAACVACTIVKHIATFLYNKFADWRFEKLEHCQIFMKEQK
ncbi:MAG: DUF393 domain-containing protein [Pseudomonadota bacterium]